MGRPSKSVLWPKNSDVSIFLKETDIVEYMETDEKGSVKTNCRGYENKKATVILGVWPIDNDHIEVPEKVLVWTCEINSRGTLSNLTFMGKTYSEERVTVIIHNEK